MPTDDRFVELCRGLMREFPQQAPEVVSEESWGDYDHAIEQFSISGSDWDCQTIFTNRSVICFVYDEAYLFLLPKLICCSLTDKGLDADILDYVVFAMKDKKERFSVLFNAAQREALVPTLRHLKSRVMEDWPESEIFSTKIQTLIDALQPTIRPGTCNQGQTMSTQVLLKPVARSVSSMTVTLYTRAQCCCCHSAREVLEEYRDVHGFTFKEVDASDPALESLIGPTVPVIAVDGKVRFRGEVNRVMFERLIEARNGG